MHPYNKALCKKLAQNQAEYQPKKRVSRKNDQIVNIDGKNVKWGLFEQNFLEEAKLNKLRFQKFTLNKDDRNKEKTLIWKKNEGWISDDSDDEELNFKRYVKFEKK